MPAEERAVGRGLLGVLQRLAAAAPVVVAVDDIQWLDQPSARALAFAARRLGGEPVGLLVALRHEKRSRLGFDPERTLSALKRLRVDPLRLEEVHRLLEARLGVVLARPTLREVHETSGGNPFFALELARALERDGGDHVPRGPLPVPTSLRELVGARVTALPDGTQAGEVAPETAKAALALQSANESQRIMQQPAFTVAVIEFWQDDLDSATARFRGLVDRAGALGDESSIPYLHVMLGQIECVRGRLDEAIRLTEDELEHARQAGQETLVATCSPWPPGHELMLATKL